MASASRSSARRLAQARPLAERSTPRKGLPAVVESESIFLTGNRLGSQA
jgi:hypothetical protein